MAQMAADEMQFSYLRHLPNLHLKKAEATKKAETLFFVASCLRGENLRR